MDGQVHTNGLENFWSLLKRAMKGTYVSVEPFIAAEAPAANVGDSTVSNGCAA